MAVAGAYLDDGFFLFWADAASASESCDTLKASIARGLTDGVVVFVPATLYECATGIPDRQLYHVLFEEPATVGLSPFDVRDLTATLDRCDRYDVGVSPVASRPGNWPRHSGAYASIAAVPRDRGIPVLLASAQYGLSCEAKLDTLPPHGFVVVVGADDFMQAFRHAIVHVGNFDRTFASCKEHAFPDLIFAPSVRASDLGIDLLQFGSDVVKHLAYLNDSYVSDADSVHWDQFQLQRLAAAKGIDLSDESANTKNARDKIRLREVSIDIDGSPRTLMCSLHTKLEAVRGRIHFCPFRSNQQVRMVIGIFHAHLPV